MADLGPSSRYIQFSDLTENFCVMKHLIFLFEGELDRFFFEYSKATFRFVTWQKPLRIRISVYSWHPYLAQLTTLYSTLFIETHVVNTLNWDIQTLSYNIYNVPFLTIEMFTNKVTELKLLPSLSRKLHCLWSCSLWLVQSLTQFNSVNRRCDWISLSLLLWFQHSATRTTN